MDEEREQGIIIIKINVWGGRRSYYNGWRSEKNLLRKKIMDEDREQAIIMDKERTMYYNGWGKRTRYYI